MVPIGIVARVPEVTFPYRRLPATLQHLSRYAETRRRTSTQREGDTMNWSTIESGWNEFKSSARQQWSKLSHAQIDGTMGKREHLSTKVQEAYALSKEETDRQISDWQSKQVEKQAPAAKS
jgi:uncharacterized protein YjbJ (UPF0337 family)